MKAVLARIPRWMSSFYFPQLAAFALLAAIIMYWRWGGTVEDSQAYFDTVRYLRGDLPISELRAPFPYRLGVPALVAVLPFDARAAFAVVNWIFVWASALVLSFTLTTLFSDRRAGWLAGLLLIGSFSTFWYAPYLLVDPGSLFARTVFVLGVVLQRSALAQAAGLAATAIREENILLLIWLLLARRVPVMRGIMLIAGAALWLILVRFYLVQGLPAYAWTPHVAQLIAALHDWKSLATIAATCGVVVPLAAFGWKHAPAAMSPLKTLALLLALPSIYALLCVRIDGRVVWGLYPMLIPFAAAAYIRMRAGANAATVRAGATTA